MKNLNRDPAYQTKLTFKFNGFRYVYYHYYYTFNFYLKSLLDKNFKIHNIPEMLVSPYLKLQLFYEKLP